MHCVPALAQARDFRFARRKIIVSLPPARRGVEALGSSFTSFTSFRPVSSGSRRNEINGNVMHIGEFSCYFPEPEFSNPPSTETENKTFALKIPEHVATSSLQQASGIIRWDKRNRRMHAISRPTLLLLLVHVRTLSLVCPLSSS